MGLLIRTDFLDRLYKGSFLEWVERGGPVVKG